MKLSELYTYRVFFSAEDGEYVAVCAELPGLSALDPDPEAALRAARELAEVGVEMLSERGDPIPDPIASRPYSGVFKVRIPPEVHRRLSLEAAEQGVSLNRLVSAKLSAAGDEVAEPRAAYGGRRAARRGGSPSRKQAARKPSPRGRV